MSRLKMWLVYEQNDSYEGGDIPLLVVGSEKSAYLAAEKINAVASQLRERLTALPDPFEDGLADDEHERRWQMRAKAIARARWPFGIKREEWRLTSNVAAMRLPFVAEVR